MATKKEATTKVAPSKVGFWDTATGKTLRAAIYLAISSGVGYIIADIQNNPVMFGVYTPIVNTVLVLVKNLLTPEVKNI